MEEPKPMIEALLLRCKDQLAKYQVQARNVHVLLLQDSDQFLLAIQQGYQANTFDGVICIGCVFPTKHRQVRPNVEDPSLPFRYDAVTHEVMEASLDMDVPIIWGVLPANDETDALEVFGLGKEEGFFAEEVATRVVKMALLNKILFCHPQKFE